MRIIRYLLLPFSLIYWLIVFIRNKLYDWKIFKSSKASLPTIVIGNITVGGTGKTPLTIFLSNYLAENFKVAVLSRGYKRVSKDCRWANHTDSYKVIGDEPKLILLRTNKPLFLCADRLKGIDLIKKTSDTELVILDDGFQHRRLSPDLSIVLIDCTRPVFRDFFLPAGNLRDNVYRVRQADIVIFTKCNADLSEIDKKIYLRKLKLNSDKTFFSTFRYTQLYNPYNERVIDLSELSNYSVLAFAGIGNFLFFKQSLLKFSSKIEFIKFPDHWNYKNSDIKKIFSNFAKIYSKSKILITTEKDFIKLNELDLNDDFKKALFILDYKLCFLNDDEEKFKQKINGYARRFITKNQKSSQFPKYSN